ncbi:MAG: hypothetical protein FWD37_06280 [Methanomassiliicoccaceae archaeon]|nr:hypothetical protein [Methanomassiliicoccaceae archaeon]
MMPDALKIHLCDIQGRLFELSLKMGFASETFINVFMRSRCAEDYDMIHHKLQWMGESYLMEEVIDECTGKLVVGEQYSKEEMYWIGYAYRYWHFLTGENSKAISKQVPAKVMRNGYEGFHTEDISLAIEDLKQVAKLGNR